MNEEKAQEKSARCPVCGVGHLRLRIISERYDYEDRGMVVDVVTEKVPIEDCDRCGESFIGPKAVRIRHEALGRALGLLTPAELFKIRTEAELSPAEFANPLGVDEKDVLLWEQGRLLQDRAVDNLIRVLSSKPNAFLLIKSSGRFDSPGQALGLKSLVIEEKVKEESLAIPRTPGRNPLPGWINRDRETVSSDQE